MKGKQRIYLDKVVDILVRGTVIDYRRGEMKFPFNDIPLPIVPLFGPRLPILMPSSSSPTKFSTYVRNIYGLSEGETNYVWEKYKKIILDKIDNER
jgi:hypothetical protein